VDTKGILMHIDRTGEIAVADKPAAAARPSSALGLVFMSTPRTPAAGTSFGADRARDAGLFRFMGQVVDVASVFPLRQAAIVAPTAVPITGAVRIANEERSDELSHAEVDHLSGGFVPQIADAALGPPAHLVFRPLQFLPTARVFLAAALLFGELAEKKK
jgi:hypothetical protein